MRSRLAMLLGLGLLFMLAVAVAQTTKEGDVELQKVRMLREHGWLSGFLTGVGTQNTGRYLRNTGLVGVGRKSQSTL